jgi:hypothetical protein
MNAFVLVERFLLMLKYFLNVCKNGGTRFYAASIKGNFILMSVHVILFPSPLVI